MMQDNSFNDVDYDLIARFLSGECSRDEAAALDIWVAASPNNARHFADAKLIWIETEGSPFTTLDISFNPNIDVAWNRVQKRVMPVKRNMWQTQPWIKIAAVLVLISGIILSYFQFVSAPETTLAFNEDVNLNIALVDGSSVDVKAGSTLTYPQEFGNKTRKVTLSGEAFFDIKSDTSVPFIVTTKLLDVYVLGTKFNVKEIDEDNCEVYVESGLVQVNNSKGKQLIHPGQACRYNAVTGKFVVLEKKVITDQFWRNRRLIFKDAALFEVVEVLKKVYAVDIALGDAQLGERQITVRFENQDLDIVLDILSNTLNLKVDSTGNQKIVMRDATE